MKTNILYAVAAIIVGMTTFTGCNNAGKSKQAEETVMVAEEHNSRNSIDYEGTYTGTLPCADCQGICTEIILHGNSYKMTRVYEGVENKPNNTFEMSGTFEWNDNGSIITLGNDRSEQYLVGENRLFALDQNGNRITGDMAETYILKKK